VLGSNVMGYSNPQLDELLQKADNEMNPQTRTDLYRKAQAVMIDDTPALWLWEKFYPIAIRKGLVGLPSGSMHSEVFEGVGWTK
jgi:peptide/nickel transport system substrate-binding protein